MNVFAVIGSGLKKIFSGSNVLTKHISIFALGGISSVAGTHFELLKEQIKNGTALPDIPTLIVGAVIMLLIWMYFCGFGIRFMHKAFDDEENDILPDIDEKPIKTFFKVLPLSLVWILWIVLTYIVGIIPIIGWIGLIVMMFIWYPFIQFVFVAFAKDFNREGLYKYTLPIQYMKHSIGMVVLFGLAFILLWIVAIILMALILLVCMGVGGNIDSTLAVYSTGVLLSYLGFIIQMLWSYCAVQIYREKIIPELED